MGIVSACLRELPILTAEESFLAVDRTGIGTASYDKDSRTAIMDTWRSTLNIETTAAKPRPPRTVESVRAAGLKVYGPTSA